MKRLLSLLMLCLFLPLTAVAQNAPTEEGLPTASLPTASLPTAGPLTAGPALTTIGSAKINTRSDMVLITFHAVNSGDTVAEAQDGANEMENALREALKALEIPSEDVYTSTSSVATVYSYQYGKLSEGEMPKGYSISSDIAVQLRQLDLIGEVADAALQLGMEPNYDLLFENSKADEAYDRALELAVSEAMRKAELLCAAAGKELGELQTVRELESGVAPVDRLAVNPAENMENVLNYILTVEASVEIGYEMK